VLLSIAAVVSLALGLYQDIGVHETIACPDDPSKDCTPPKVDFVEGVAIIIAILIVVMVGSLNDWQKERQFRALNERKEDRTVKVIRDGKEQQINIKVSIVVTQIIYSVFHSHHRTLWLVISQSWNLVKSFHAMVFSFLGTMSNAMNRELPANLMRSKKYPSTMPGMICNRTAKPRKIVTSCPVPRSWKAWAATLSLQLVPEVSMAES
jgi:hypothetical protein